MTDQRKSRVVSSIPAQLYPTALVIVALFLGAAIARAESLAPIAKRLPGNGLVLYLEYDGLDAHAKAWEATAASAIINRTPTGAMAAEVSRQALDQLLKAVPDAKLGAGELTALLREVVDEGFAVAIYDRGEGSSYGVLVYRGLGRQDARQRLEKLRVNLMGTGENPKAPPAVKIRGREVYQAVPSPATDAAAALIKPAVPRPPGNAIQEVRRIEPVGPAKGGGNAAPVAVAEPSQSFWFEGNDLFIVVSDSNVAPAEPAEGEVAAKAKRPRFAHRDDLEAVFDAVEGKSKTASTEEGYITALDEGKDIKGFEPDGLFFVDLGGKSGLLKGLLEGVGAVNPLASISPLQGISLPRGQYIQDDVKYVAPAVAVGPAVEPSDATATELNVAPVPSRPKPATPAPTDANTAPVAAAPENRSKRADAGEAPEPAVGKEAPKAIDEIAILGLRGVRSFVVRWGFQGKGLVTVVRVEIPAPRSGLMALVDQPGFRKDRLPPIPRRVSSFAIGSFDPARSYELIAGQAKAIDAEIGALVGAGEKAVQDATGLRLREDLLAHVGPTWCTFDVAEGPHDYSQGLSRGQVVVVGLRDAEGFAKVLDTAATKVNGYLRSLETGGKEADAGARDREPPALALERLPAPDRGYQLTSPAGLVVWLDEETRPTVLVGRSWVVIAANPELARAVLKAESVPVSSWHAEGEVARTLADMPAELTSLSVADAADSALPQMIAKLPAYVQLLGNLIGTSATDAEVGPASAILAMVGLPRASGFRLHLDPAKLPKASAVRAHLFPSVLATTVDDRGLRWIAREAFPFAAVSAAVPVKPKFKIDLTQPLGSRLKFDLDMLGVKTK